jgi:hypothetical protein
MPQSSSPARKLDFNESQRLAGLGFKHPERILKLASKTAALDIDGFVIPKIQFLRDLGFHRPERIIDIRPAFLFIDRGSLAEKIKAMKTLGFKNPVKMMDRFPSLSGFDVEGNLKPKLEFLLSLGFADPIKMIEAMPAAVCINIHERVPAHLDGLRGIGFDDPVLMISRCPAILFFSIEEKIVPKIRFLSAAGFHDPVRMIERRPTLIGLNAEKNIQPTLIELAHWNYSLAQIERKPSLLSPSLTRIREVRERLDDLSFPVSKLPSKLKQQVIESLKFSDVELNFWERGILTLDARARALADVDNWPWIFRRYRVPDAEALRRPA